jgi:hypothetical protein
MRPSCLAVFDAINFHKGDVPFFAEFRQIYDLANDKGLKGCTTFRPNAVTGLVLTEAAGL